MPLIAIGLQLWQTGADTDRLVKCAAPKIVGAESSPDTSEVGILTLTTTAAETHEEAQELADRYLDECADELGIADRQDLVTVVR